MKKFLSLVMMCWISTHIHSQEVFGVWQTLDEKTGEATSDITIMEEKGELIGVITKILSGEKKVCSRCKGAKKDQSFEGLEIIWGFRKDEDGNWKGGEILDPRNGKTYKCNLSLAGQNTLEVRGYVGAPMFGRTQEWKRKTQ